MRQSPRRAPIESGCFKGHLEPGRIFVYNLDQSKPGVNMYDSDSIRRQLEEVWAKFIIEQTGTRLERANKYKTKKIMMRAHGVQAYYDIEFQPHFLALSHQMTNLADAKPFELLHQAPTMIGVLGALAEAMGLVEKTHAEPVQTAPAMEEDMFFAQHFSSSMSDALSGIRKKSSSFGW